LRFPAGVDRQLERLTTELPVILGSRLRGIYLHGSLAMGCFNPELSDIDLLVRVRDEPSADEEQRIVELLLGVSGDPAPIELSVLSDADLVPWRYPTPYRLHFSEEWREWLESGGGQPDDRLDPDLAAHITVLRFRGETLYGEELSAVFPRVPAADYLDSLLRDVAWARERMSSQPLYAVLNLPRVLRYVTDGAVISKREAGEWALGQISGEDRTVLEAALHHYRGESDSFSCTVGDVRRYVARLEAAIETRLRGGTER
jgi:predicted nucleotidyltransferase